MCPSEKDSTVNELWSSAMRRLSSKIAPQNFDMWLRPIECDSIDGQVVRLKAPNPYVKLWFESNYLESILSELQAETGTTYQVEFEVLDTTSSVGLPTPPMPELARVADELPTQESVSPFAAEAMVAPTPTMTSPPQAAMASGTGPITRPTNPAQPSAAHGAGASAQVGAPTSPTDPLLDNSIINVALNPRYNFDTFVSGPSNQLAFAAAQSCANSYPPKYNPVFVCGGVGLGKTHLLHAIGHQILAKRPEARLCYISGERFMNEYVHAIRTNQMHTFRTRYRESLDVLLVDDVQFLAGKDGTQDEFFHTFNALHDSHRQIVLTADRKPHEISDIADRLRSRFAWGLSADIEAPELEVRMAILSKKAAAENIHLPDNVSMYIASSIKSNVRELEGALIRLAAYASLSRKEITLEFARETLEGSITRPPEHLTVDTILKSVASYYGLKVSDLKSPRRHKSIAGPRAVAMYLARTHTKESYPDLGRAFGGKHHTTVIAAVEKVTTKLRDDNGLRGEVAAIEKNLLR
jgi:chromosomal replication initiator protein